MTDTATVERLGMLASALAGRPLVVAATADGEPAWTDGKTIYLDGSADLQAQLEALAVQACLLAGGGLESEIVGKLARKQKLADRYLAVEGRRALGANAELLPARLRALLDGAATDSASAAASLQIAQSKASIPESPACFGTIRIRKLAAAQRAAEKSKAAAQARHRARRDSGEELPELLEDAETEEIIDPFSSPVGGGGAIGKLLAKLTSKVRQLGSGGSPGADSPTNRRRSANAGAGAVASSLRPDGEDDTDTGRAGFRYPEWDAHRRRYRHDWCTVTEVEVKARGEGWTMPDGHAVRRSLTRLGMGLSRHHRQRQGDDLDVDAVVESRVEVAAGSAPDDAVYVDNLRQRRDLSVLVLLDVSGSAAEAGSAGGTVHEQQRAAAAALTAALHELGDRVALYAYHSQGRSAVELNAVKRFDDRFDAAAMRRLYGLQPGAYSRLGAAIRHGVTILTTRAGTPRRLLVVISDGLAYDHGYERGYGAADARRALAEAAQDGVGCVCLTVGAGTDVADLRAVFGTAAHATVRRPDQLSRVIGPLFRVALARAEARRRRP